MLDNVVVSKEVLLSNVVPYEEQPCHVKTNASDFFSDCTMSVDIFWGF